MTTKSIAKVQAPATFLDLDGRFTTFEVDGVERRFAHVTTVLGLVRVKGFLDKWEQELIDALGIDGYRAFMDKKASEGTAMHNLIEKYLSGTGEIIVRDNEPCNNTAWRKFAVWESWWLSQQDRPKVVWMERGTYSVRHGVCGKPDMLGKLPDGLWVYDWKSGKASEKHKLQTACYIKMLEETEGLELAGARIISCGEDTKTGFKETIISCSKKHKNSSVGENEVDYYFRGFLLHKALVDFEIPRFGPNDHELPSFITPNL